MNKRGLDLPKKRGFIAPASLIKRFASYFIDLIIINFIILIPFKKVLSKIIPQNSSYIEVYHFIENNPEISSIFLALSLLIGILAVLYFTYFEYYLQQTPGKMLMNIYIIPENRKLSFWNYLVSNLTFLPFFPFILLWIIDPVYMFISPKNQRFMEKLTKILVVQKYFIDGGS